MSKEELIDDAKRAVKSYIERELATYGETVVYPVMSIKLDHDPEGEWDGVNDAILVSKDEKTGEVHLYIMTCIMHRDVIKEIFDTEIRDYIGHIVIDSEEKSKKYLPLVKNFSLDDIRKRKLANVEEKKMRFSEWNNI